MKKPLIIIIFILFVAFTTNSCKKAKVPEGEYEFTFVVINGEAHGTPVSLRYKIIESTRTYFIINNSFSDTIYKNNQEINGTIRLYGGIASSAQNIFYTQFNLNGNYEKIDGDYIITGSFSSQELILNNIEERMDTIDISGSFSFIPVK